MRKKVFFRPSVILLNVLFGFTLPSSKDAGI
jgi:hypothetical protein